MPVFSEDYVNYLNMCQRRRRPESWPWRLICRIPYSSTHRHHGVFRSAVNLTVKLPEHCISLICCILMEIGFCGWLQKPQTTYLEGDSSLQLKDRI